MELLSLARTGFATIDADSKLVPTFLVGPRDTATAYRFISDLAGRLKHRIQLSTYGHKPYLMAVEGAFGSEIDYAMIQKLYGVTPEHDTRYSPAECIGTQTHVVEGNPDPAHISTSYVERSNLSLRMHNRRFTRLTNAFSKKFENHCHALALYFMFYNWVRIHKTLRVTPAMAAGLTNKLLSMEDVAAMIDAQAAKPDRPKVYRKRVPQISN